MLVGLLSACASSPLPAPAAKPAAALEPNVAVYVATLELPSGRLGAPLNITPGKGSNFQPAFLTDGSGLLYVSQRSGTPNIYRYDFAKGQTTALTRSAESLYSPTPLADGRGFSAIRVQTADPFYGAEAKAAPVWRFGWDGHAVEALIETRRVGYHAWIDEQQLALFLVDEVPERNAHRAVLVDRRSGKQVVLSEHPGSGFAPTPDGRRASFVDKSDPKQWVLMAMGLHDERPQRLVDLPPLPPGEKDSTRSHYFAWLPDGSLLLPQGGRLLRWDGRPGSEFKPFADLRPLGGVIKNLAVSPDGSRFAFSLLSEESLPAP
ncbi:hypothetical protein WG899_15355 [Paucibacter sp. AS339]|uniref:hypothetical protein n=1 Tax=Paucibacter hankyongi TaxID=3133434 RepID=UPI0030B58FB7